MIMPFIKENKFPVSRAIMFSLFVGIVFVVADIATFAFDYKEYNSSGMSPSKFTSSLSLAALSNKEVQSAGELNEDLFGQPRTAEEKNIVDAPKALAFVVLPIVFSLILAGIVLLLKAMLLPGMKMTELWMGLILILAYPAVNILVYIIAKPVSNF